MIQSNCFSHAFADSEIAEVVDRWLWSEWSSVQMRSAPCPFLLHFFFCEAAEPDCVVVLMIPWHIWQGQRLNSYRSGWRRPLSSSLDRYWVWLSKRLKFFGLSSARILPVPTVRRSFFALCAFSAFSKIFGATFEKNTNFAMRLSRPAHDREICRRHFEAHLALWWNRALPPPPPPFFWRYTTPPCGRHRIEWTSSLQDIFYSARNEVNCASMAFLWV